MDIEQIQKNSSYLHYCKEFYFLNIRPSNEENRESKEYKLLVEIANLYFKNNLHDNFAGYLMEYQYLVQLWTAHLILEFGNPDDNLIKVCLNEIIKYSKTPLDLTLAKEETKWLNDNKSRYLKFLN